MAAWQAAGEPVDAGDGPGRASWLRAAPAYTVLDVRDRTEWEGGHIPGAINRPAGELVQGAAVPVNGSRHVAVICGTGFRSAVASSLLQQKGNHDIVQRDRRHECLARSRVADQGQWSCRRTATIGVADESSFGQSGYLGEAQVVDVREPRRVGSRPPGGSDVLMPLGELGQRRHELDPQAPVVIVCRSGRRSLTAAEILLEAGFRDVRSLAGGMIAWRAARMPVER